MPNQINPNTERTRELVAKIGELADAAPAVVIKWYDELDNADKLLLLAGIAQDIAQLQQISFVVLRTAYALMGVLARDAQGGDFISVDEKLPDSGKLCEVKTDDGRILKVRWRRGSEMAGTGLKIPGYWECADSEIIYNVTHWREMHRR